MTKKKKIGNSCSRRTKKKRVLENDEYNEILTQKPQI